MSTVYNSGILYKKIRNMASELGFAAVGCAKAEELGQEADLFDEAVEKGYFAGMTYLGRNIDKRRDPRLLLPGAKSVLVFLAPFGQEVKKDAHSEGCHDTSAVIHGRQMAVNLKISEFALGSDYHKVIKDKLYLIAQLIKDSYEESQESDSVADDMRKEPVCRVFTDSAPVLERAWAVRAGLGFIGKNNFLISPECGIKNFIGVIITKAELPYYQSNSAKSATAGKTGECKVPDESCVRGKTNPFVNGCGNCTRCIDACSQHALYAPFKLNAAKCLSYKTIESRSLAEQINRNWIFGCDDCMNACPWNSRNKQGWPEFSILKNLLGRTTPEFWESMTDSEFTEKFKETPLLRAGREKICASVKSYLCNAITD